MQAAVGYGLGRGRQDDNLVWMLHGGWAVGGLGAVACSLALGATSALAVATHDACEVLPLMAAGAADLLGPQTGALLGACLQLDPGNVSSVSRSSGVGSRYPRRYLQALSRSSTCSRLTPLLAAATRAARRTAECTWAAAAAWATAAALAR